MGQQWFFIGGIHIHIVKPNIIWRFFLSPSTDLWKGQTWNTQVFFRSTNPLLLREILFCCLILKSHANTMRIKHSILSIITQSYNNKYKTSESKTSFKQLQTTKFLVTLNNIMDFKPCTGILHYKPLGYLFCYDDFRKRKISCPHRWDRTIFTFCHCINGTETLSKPTHAPTFSPHTYSFCLKYKEGSLLVWISKGVALHQRQAKTKGSENYHIYVIKSLRYRFSKEYNQFVIYSVLCMKMTKFFY